MRLFPLTIAELNERPLAKPWVDGARSRATTLAEVALSIERGGMPGICFLRDSAERQQTVDAWLETTCFRDLQQVRGSRLEGELALDVVRALAVAPQPTLAAASAALRVDSRRVARHIEALEAVFALHRLEPHPAGVGKTHFLPFDAGIAHHLGASQRSCLRIWALNECLAQHEYEGVSRPRLRHYQSTGRSAMDLVVESGGGTTGVLLSEEEAPPPYALRAARAFIRRIPEVQTMVLAPVRDGHRVEAGVDVVPWAAMA
jgi:predicted AAA+ superfamily ATPase